MTGGWRSGGQKPTQRELLPVLLRFPPSWGKSRVRDRVRVRDRGGLRMELGTKSLCL